MGGFMGTPPAPAQPPQVNFTTTAESRGGFNNFLRSIPSTTAMTPIPPMGSYPMPPMGGNPMANIDIFNQPPSMGMGMMGMNQPQMNPMMQQSMMQPPMMNQQPMMMADGGGVPPRRTEIMGQDHMLSYITPEEGGILKALGGAGKPGPMGIPSFYSNDAQASTEGPGNDSSNDNNDYSDFSGDNTFSDNNDYSDFSGSNNYDDSDPDSDMDYTDSYDTKEDQEADFSAASNIGFNQNIANIAADAKAKADLAAKNQAALNQQIKNAAFVSQAKKGQADRANMISNMQDPMNPYNQMVDRSTSGSMPGGPPTSNVQAASTTNFSNIGAKGDDDPLGLSLQGVGLGPSINTPSIASVSPTSGPNTNADITGFGSGRDKSDFSTDIDALSNVEEQAKKGSFPNLDKVPGTLGVITGLINAATKRGAQNTIDNISKGFAPNYDKDGNITGTTNYGIGMGQPGGLFGSGTTVDNYDVFDKTSPSLGMYDDKEIGGDDNDNPLLLRKPIVKPIEEDDGDKPPNVIGGGDLITPPASVPVVVDSPFTSNIGDYTPVNFSTGDLNDLIASLTGIASPQSMAQGGVAGYAEGGLINAVDNFLASV